VLQEDLLRDGPVPWSIVRATQFFEFVDAVLSWTADGKSVRLPNAVSLSGNFVTRSTPTTGRRATRSAPLPSE
jgi:hypothetical protein